MNMSWLQKFNPPATIDEIRRRKNIILILGTALTILSAVLVITSFVANNNLVGLGTLVAGISYVLSLILTRYEKVNLGGYLLIAGAYLNILTTLFYSGSFLNSLVALFFMILPILLASNILPNIHTVVVYIACIIPITYLITTATTTLDMSVYITAAGFVTMIAVIAYLSAWTVSRAFQRTSEARQELEQANLRLTTVNDQLEIRVAERTTNLNTALLGLQQRELDLQQALYDLHTSQEAVRQLSAPILPVSPTVLVAPLIGAIDSGRATILMENMLKAAETEVPRFMIIDVTGLPLIDVEVGRLIIQSSQALRLLGVQTILTGVRPEVAQTLVGLGIDLSIIITRSTLQNGITEALHSVSKASVSHNVP